MVSCENNRGMLLELTKIIRNIQVLIPGEDVKIHYLGWNQKWDKVIKLTSPSVRYKRQEMKEVKLNFKVGQKVMALFVDGNMYAGIL